MESARRAGVRLLGPNTVGFVNAWDRVALTFSTVGKLDALVPGPVAVLSQSGGLGGCLLDRAADRGLGVGLFVSTGNEADLSLADYLDWLVEDGRARAIACLVEQVREPGRVAAAVERAAARGIAVVAMKLGGSVDRLPRRALAHRLPRGRPRAVAGLGAVGGPPRGDRARPSRRDGGAPRAGADSRRAAHGDGDVVGRRRGAARGRARAAGLHVRPAGGGDGASRGGAAPALRHGRQPARHHGRAPGRDVRRGARRGRPGPGDRRRRRAADDGDRGRGRGPGRARDQGGARGGEASRGLLARGAARPQGVPGARRGARAALRHGVELRRRARRRARLSLGPDPAAPSRASGGDRRGAGGRGTRCRGRRSARCWTVPGSEWRPR